MRPEEGTLSASAASGWLAIRFDAAQLDRMHVLATKNKAGKLSVRERAELENYREVSFLLDLMHSKARRSLQKKKALR
jgi:hypothetical protein